MARRRAAPMPVLPPSQPRPSLEPRSSASGAERATALVVGCALTLAAVWSVAHFWPTAPTTVIEAVGIVGIVGSAVLALGLGHRWAPVAALVIGAAVAVIALNGQAKDGVEDGLKDGGSTAGGLIADLRDKLPGGDR